VRFGGPLKIRGSSILFSYDLFFFFSLSSSFVFFFLLLSGRTDFDTKGGYKKKKMCWCFSFFGWEKGIYIIYIYIYIYMYLYISKINHKRKKVGNLKETQQVFEI
jgi:hypothetical protein